MTTTATSLYDTDFYGWTQHQADALRAKHMSELDFDNLLEEIEAMGRGEKRGLRNRLAILLMHLLKWKYQPDYQGKSWTLTILEQRDQIRELMEESPSLYPLLSEYMEKAWETAKRKAERETKIARSTFPHECPWSFDQIMNDDFWPQ